MTQSMPPGFISDADFAKMQQEEQQQQQPQIDPRSVPGFISDEEFARRDDIAPSYASGLSPETPMNESPIDLTDRLLLNVGQVGGNMKGNIDWYKNKGYEVKEKDGNLVLKDPKDGLWKYADEQDAWEISGNIYDKMKNKARAAAGDVIDIVPDAVDNVVTNALRALGVGMTATGAGASVGIAATVGAQAAVTGTRVALGRYLNTYKNDTPEELMMDVGTELFFAGLGETIRVGVRPTAQKLGSLLQKGADKIPMMPQSAKETLASVSGLLSGAPKEKVAVILDDSNIARRVGHQLEKYGRQSFEAIDANEKGRTIKTIQTYGKVLTEIRDGVWKNGEKAVIEAAGDSAVYDPKLIMNAVTKDPQFMGLITKDPAGIFKIADRSTIENALGLRDEKAVTNVYRMLRNIAKTSNMKAKSGRDAAEFILKDEVQLNAGMRDLYKLMDAGHGSAAQPFIDNFASAFKSINAAGLPEQARSAHIAMRSNYEFFKNAAQEFIDKTNKDSFAQIAPFVNKLFTQRAAPTFTSVAADNIYEDAANAAKKFASPRQLLKIKAIESRLQQQDLVRTFAARVRPGLKGVGGAIGAGGVLTATSLFGPTAALVAGGAAAATSPRLNFKVTPNLLKAALATKTILANAGNKGLDTLYKNPSAMQMILETPFKSYMEEDQLRATLGSQIQGAMGVGQ